MVYRRQQVCKENNQNNICCDNCPSPCHNRVLRIDTIASTWLDAEFTTVAKPSISNLGCCLKWHTILCDRQCIRVAKKAKIGRYGKELLLKELKQSVKGLGFVGCTLL